MVRQTPLPQKTASYPTSRASRHSAHPHDINSAPNRKPLGFRFSTHFSPIVPLFRLCFSRLFSTPVMRGWKTLGHWMLNFVVRQTILTPVHRIEAISMRTLKERVPRSGARRTGRSMHLLLGRVSLDTYRHLLLHGGYPSVWLATGNVCSFVPFGRLGSRTRVSLGPWRS